MANATSSTKLMAKDHEKSTLVKMAKSTDPSSVDQFHKIDWTDAPKEWLDEIFPLLPGMGTLAIPPKWDMSTEGISGWRELTMSAQENIYEHLDSTEAEIWSAIMDIAEDADVNEKEDCSSGGDVNDTLQRVMSIFASIGEDTNPAVLEEKVDMVMAILDSSIGEASDSPAYNYALDEIIKSLPLFQEDGEVKPLSSSDLRRSTEPLVDRLRRYTVCKALNLTQSQGRVSRGEWLVCDRVMGVSQEKIDSRPQGRHGWKIHSLFHWWNRKDKETGEFENRTHPYDQDLALVTGTGGSGEPAGFSLNDMIEMLTDLRTFQREQYPWLVPPGSKGEVCLPCGDYWVNKLKDIIDSRVLNLIRRVHSFKKDASAGSLTLELLQVLVKEGGLVVDNTAYKKRYHEMVRISNDDDNSDSLINSSHLLVFGIWAGLSNEDLTKYFGRNMTSYPSISKMKKYFKSYQQHDDTKLIIEGLNILADCQSKVTIVGIENLDVLHQVFVNGQYMRADNMLSYRREVKRRLTLNNGKPVNECAGGETCGCNKNGLFIGPTIEFHHYNEHCEKMKKETTFDDGTVKEPGWYNESDWEFQREFVIPVCRFYHRLVTSENYTQQNRDSKEVYNYKVRDALAVEQSNGGCFMTGLQPSDNFGAFDNHHLAWSCNLVFGNVTLVVKKYSEVSSIARMRNGFEDLVENLFPEIILTRLLDCRVHKITHFMINRPLLCKKLKAEFPFELDNVDGQAVLRYTGELSKTRFSKMEKQTIELPSATEVLGLNNTGKKVSRRVIHSQSRGKSD